MIVKSSAAQLEHCPTHLEGPLCNIPVCRERSCVMFLADRRRHAAGDGDRAVAKSPDTGAHAHTERRNGVNGGETFTGFLVVRLSDRRHGVRGPSVHSLGAGEFACEPPLLRFRGGEIQP